MQLRRSAASSRPPRRPSRRVTAGLVAAAVTFAGSTAAWAATEVLVKNQGNLTAVGPISSATGFPAWYQDSTGTRVELCLDGDNPLCGFLPGDIPNEAAPIEFPGNFPSEIFYQLADSSLDLPGGGSAVLTLGLEAAFANDIPQEGDQVVFGRQRIVVKDGPANTALIFQHPFGTIEIDTNASGDGRLVEDISPAVGNFQTALKSNFGPFLKWPSGAPDGYLGNPDVEHVVTGSPTGYNKFSVTGGGLNLETNLFTITGKIATNHGVKADAAQANGSFVDVFATALGGSLEVKAGPGYQTTPMLHDPDTDRYYARVAVDGALPASVTVQNVTDKPVSTSAVPVSKPFTLTAAYNGSSLAVTSSVDGVSIAGFGPLNGTTGSFPAAAPPATVTGTSSGTSITVPVLVTGGEASPSGQVPVTPQPDPGPVTETEGDTGVPPTPTDVAAVIAPVSPQLVGSTFTLDGSGTTGATTYAWTQTSGSAVTVNGADTAKPTVTIPFYAKTTDTTQQPPLSAPLTFTLVAKNADGATSEKSVSVDLTTDTLAVTAARHRIGSELRIDGTSLINGQAGVLAPATQVVIYDTTPGRNVTKLGTAQVDTLGAWSFRQRPGPAAQITSVSIQSSRGGTLSSGVTTR
ncbi:MAG TPA: hypothetical protein VN520_19940 [Streptomyces sp.]|uniref:hypothetical protein n=1 Tax=Streptomyces sp. TaxID=1931 RepID=UPI002C771CFF|nr:hypothetical protein [Streptomyces sp.]HWU08619.1 hypothetical protein [Streptomyces sp.]